MHYPILVLHSLTFSFLGHGWLHKLWSEWTYCCHMGCVPRQGDHPTNSRGSNSFYSVEGMSIIALCSRKFYLIKASWLHNYTCTFSCTNTKDDSKSQFKSYIYPWCNVKDSASHFKAHQWKKGIQRLPCLSDVQ